MPLVIGLASKVFLISAVAFWGRHQAVLRIYVAFWKVASLAAKKRNRENSARPLAEAVTRPFGPLGGRLRIREGCQEYGASRGQKGVAAACRETLITGLSFAGRCWVLTQISKRSTLSFHYARLEFRLMVAFGFFSALGASPNAEELEGLKIDEKKVGQCIGNPGELN